MTKTRRITISILLLAGSYYYEIHSYQPPPTFGSTGTVTEAGTEAGTAAGLDWIAVLVRAAIAAVPYIALDVLWSRRHR